MKFRFLLVLLFSLIAATAMAIVVHARESYFRPALGDIVNTSAAYERAVVTEEGGLHLYSGEGKLLSGFPVLLSNRVFVSSPVFANMVGDGTKNIVVIARDGSGVYKLVMLDGKGQLVAETDVTGSTFFDPAVLKVNSLKDSILLATEQGKVFEVSFENNALKLIQVLDAQAPVALSTDGGSLRFFLSFPKSSSLKMYQKSGNSWSLQKTFALQKPFVYPVLFDGVQRVYGIQDTGSLSAIHITSGSVVNGFPVMPPSFPVDAPIFAEVDVSISGKEIVLNLSNGKRFAVDTSGKVLSVELEDKSFGESSLDVAESNDGLYAAVRNYGGIIIQKLGSVVSSIYSGSFFDMSWWKDSNPSVFVGVHSGTKWDSVNSVLTLDAPPLIYFQFEETAWKNPKEVISFFNSKNNGIALNGVASSAEGKFGRGVQFDGVDDYISTSVLYGNATGWTAAAWYKTDNKTKSRMALIGGNNGGRFEVYVHQGRPGCRIWDTKERSIFTDEIYVGEWHHVACVQEYGTNPLTKLYVDGVLKKSVNYSSVPAGNAWLIGKPGSTLSTYYQGKLDDVLVTHRSFADSEVAALYSQQYGTFVSQAEDAGQVTSRTSFAPVSVEPYGKELPGSQVIESGYFKGNMSMDQNVFLAHFNEPSASEIFVDSSGSGQVASCIGIACPVSVPGRFRNTLQMDGVDDMVQVLNSPGIQLVDNFTAMGWVKRDKLYGWDGFFGKLKYAKGLYNGWNVNFDLPTKKIGATVGCNGVYKTIRADVQDNFLWHHVALRVESGKVSLFIDGIEQADSTQTAICDSGENLVIGRYYSDYPDHYLHGLVDEVAIFGRSLSTGEIFDAYKRGTSRIEYQVRSCDDAACFGESFVGPDGTSSSYFSELENSTEGLPLFSLNVPENRYFQYFIRFTSFGSPDNPGDYPGLSKIDVN